MTIRRDQLEEFLNDLLQPAEFSDYGPNGLQIEGSDTIDRIAFAVSASAESIGQAVAANAQALVVHHGLFWHFHGVRTLTGPFARRVFPLIQNAVSLFGYHLPLDAHPEIGNAATLAHRLGISEQQPFGDYKGRPTGVSGVLHPALSAAHLREKLQTVLDHPVLLASPDDSRPVQRVGLITGGANGEWRTALAAGLDAYITGEMSEHDWHESREAGIHMYAGGHNATESFGIQALMQRVAERLPVDCFYLPSANPA